MNRKICVATGSRAEYGLLRWVMQRIKDDSELTLQIIATGMHMSPEFGLTYKEIEQDGFVIDRKVEMLLSADTPVGIAKSMGLGLIGFSDALESLAPDILVLLGDRFEVFSVASAATVLRIPIAHLHGGEITAGSIDDIFRHAISKMSHVHFTATEEYRKRVIQLGECPDRVINSGAPGLENIYRLELLEKEELEKKLMLSFGECCLLVGFHPETTAPGQNANYLKALFSVLDELNDAKLIFTRSNSDVEGRLVNQLVDDYVSRNRHKAAVYTTLGQRVFLSTLKHVNGIVGNSSSGIIEAPSLNTGTINIGYRQHGRVRAESVIDCEPDTASIKQAFEKLFSPQFSKIIEKTKNPYGGGNVSEIIVDYLKEITIEQVRVKFFFQIGVNNTD